MRESFRSKFESNPVVYVSTLVIGAFVAGFSAHKNLVSSGESQSLFADELGEMREVLNEQMRETSARIGNHPTLDPHYFDFKVSDFVDVHFPMPMLRDESQSELQGNRSQPRAAVPL